MVSSPTNRSVRPAQVEIRIVDPGTAAGNRPNDRQLAKSLQAVMDAALEPELRDDRFAGWQSPNGLVLALATADDQPVAFLGGGLSRGRLQLDGLMSSSRTGSEASLLAMAMHQALAPSVEAAEAKEIELWGKPARPWHRALADHHGYAELRALHQMRCPLPVDAAALTTRPFVLGRDEGLLIRVNNRAFADHPDQGNMTEADLAEAADQPWFDPDGIRLFEDPDGGEYLAGFCWTKIHQPLAPGQPKLGEIYAIGIDPDHHGNGLGVPMTAAGLSWLADKGLATGMLYVEADNTPAIRTYERLGFERHRTDRAWRKRGPDRE